MIMSRNKRIAAAVLILSLAPLLLHARPATGSEASVLPRGMGMGMDFSLRSISEALDSLDAFFAAASRDSADPIPPGLVKSMAQTQLSIISLKLWDRDGEAHMLVPFDSTSREHVFVMPVADSAFLDEALKRERIPAEPDPAHDCLRVTLPKMGAFLIAPLDARRILLAAGPAGLDAIRTAWRDGWRPRHWAEGVFGLEVVPPEGWVEKYPTAFDLGWRMAELSERVGGIPDNRRPSTGDPLVLTERERVIGELIRGYAAATRKALVGLIQGLGGIERFRLDVGVDDNGVALKLILFPRPELALAPAAGRARPDNAAARFARPGAAALLVAAPAEEIWPGLSECAEDLVRALAEKALPDRMEELSGRTRDLIRYGAGEGAVARYAGAAGPYYAAWVKSERPDAAIESYLSLFGILNFFFRLGLAAWAPGSDLTFLEITEATAPDGTPYRRVRLHPGLEALLPALRKSSGADARLYDRIAGAYGNFSAWLAVKDGYAVVVTGKAGEEEFLAALAAPAGADAAGALWESPAARRALDSLRPGRFATLLLDLNQAALEYAETKAAEAREIQEPGFGGPSVQHMLEAYRRALPVFKRSEDLAAVGLGAGDGELVCEVAVSAGAVGTVYANATLFRKILLAVSAERPKGTGAK